MKKSFVYFVAAPGRIKIGFTTQPESRLAALQAVDMERLSMVAIVEGSRKLEMHLHKLAAPHRYVREWFLDCPEVRELIQLAVDGKIAFQEEAKALVSLSRQYATALVEHERSISGSKMMAYVVVAQSLGVSAGWLRKYVKGYEESEPKLTVYENIKSRYAEIHGGPI